jgi:hypothetical protein
VWLHGDGPEQFEGPLLSAVGRGIDLEGGCLGFRRAGAAGIACDRSEALERAAAEQSQSELPLVARGPPAPSSLL